MLQLLAGMFLNLLHRWAFIHLFTTTEDRFQKPFSIIVSQCLTFPKVREDLAKAAFGQSFLKEAPVDIVVCVEPERSATRYGERGAELYCFQDTAAAAQNILLMAEGLGLSTCWVGAFDEKAVSQILEIPSGRRPVAIIPVGYSILAAPPKPPARRTLDEVVKIVN
jgi:nitroreductase